MTFIKRRKVYGFTLIELLIVIVIIGILISIALPNFQAAQYRTKLASVKGNMHTVQIMAETYAVDWAGVYGESLAILNGEAVSKNYSKIFLNPLNPSLFSVIDSADILPTVNVVYTAPDTTTGAVVYHVGYSTSGNSGVASSGSTSANTTASAPSNSGHGGSGSSGSSGGSGASASTSANMTASSPSNSGHGSSGNSTNTGNSYLIFGLDKVSKPIKDRGNIFFLTNN